MLDQVYELNLPPLDEILHVSILTYFNDESISYNYITGDIDSIIKPEMKNFLGFNWKTFRYFKKSNCNGSLHTDLNNINNFNDEKCAWGINWILGGHGNIKFWELKNVKCIGFTPGALNDANNGVVPKFVPKKVCDWTYKTELNKVYLINASLPHLASGEKHRIAFSLRTDDYSVKWEEIVNKFKSFIVKSKN